MLQETLQNNSNVIDTKTYLEYLHKDSNDSYVVVANKINGKWEESRFLYSVDSVCDNMGKNDCYITLNNFTKGRRTLRTLNNYTSFYIDIDCYKLLSEMKLEFNKKNVEFLKRKVLFELEEDYFNSKIPTPTFIIDSGRGLYLQWKINQLSKDYTERWNSIQKVLLNVLKSLGADSQSIDGARVLRIPGSVNTKEFGGNVEVIEFNDICYDLEEFEMFFEYELTESTKKEKRNIIELSKKTNIKSKKKDNNKKVKKNNKTSFIFKDRSLYVARIDDIETLCELRGYELSKYKCRELVLFLYRYWLTKFTRNPQEALKKTLELNRRFDIPLSDERVKVDTESAYRVFKEGIEYRYTNNKLIDILNITEDEQMKLSTIISAKIKSARNNEKCKERNKANRRNLNGLTLREQSKQELINKVHDLKAKGFKQVEIAEELDITKGTVSKYLKLPYVELIKEEVKEKSFLERMARIGEGESSVVGGESLSVITNTISIITRVGENSTSYPKFTLDNSE